MLRKYVLRGLLYTYVCMCLYIYMCVCACMYVCACMCVCMYVHMYVCVCMYVRTYVCVCMYVCMYVCTYICMCVYICMYACMYVAVRMSILILYTTNNFMYCTWQLLIWYNFLYPKVQHRLLSYEVLDSKEREREREREVSMNEFKYSATWQCYALVLNFTAFSALSSFFIYLRDFRKKWKIIAVTEGNKHWKTFKLSHGEDQ